MATYTIDPMHSEVTFKIKHLMISSVSGNFKQFNASFTSDKEDLSDAAITFEADINSIHTSNDQRDGHLKSPEFFDAEKFPKLSFTSTKLVPVNGNEYKLEGNLTIKDVTKPVTLGVEYAGKMVDPYGNEKHGFEIGGKISRKEFGLTWNALTESGGVVVSDEVKLMVNAQFTKS